MTTKATTHEEEIHKADAKALFGFWAYIMSDCLLFASLFAAYAVLHNRVFNGPSASEIFSMPFVLTETIILLTSSFTYGLVTYYAHHRDDKAKVLYWLVATFILGAIFVGMEVTEFAKLYHEGYGPNVSAFLSSFFALVGTHGLHVTAGLIWMAALFVQVLRQGITQIPMRNLSVLGLFWHFLDIIWIFIFTIVYLMGAI
jgi:cytochrome o ubiquinol oxidase subunit III